MPKAKEDKNVLVVSHGNALRALIKYMENISDEGMIDVEMPFGAIFIYDVDENGRKLSKTERIVSGNVPA